MSRPHFLLGTIRGRRGDRYVVVTAAGEQVPVTFESIDTPPAIGADVIGIAAIGADGEALMRLVDDVRSELLRGRSRIAGSGRPDLTARMLAAALAGSGPAFHSGGAGGIIERSPSIDDDAVMPAFATLAPEAARLGIALNLVDVLRASGQAWSDAEMTEQLLPADASGEADALEDMRRCFLSGMTARCRRTVVAMSEGGRAVPSVDFIVPYSPFSTGLSLSQELAGASKDEIVRMPLSPDFARELSSWRQMSKAFLPRHVGRMPRDPMIAFHVEESFADVAAVLFMLKEGCDPDEALAFARLREAGFARGGTAGRYPASHAAVGEAIAAAGFSDAACDPEAILSTAADVVLAAVPRDRVSLSRLAGRASSRAVAPADMIGEADFEAYADFLRREIEQGLGRLPNDLARERFETHLGLALPFRLEAVADEMLAPYRAGGVFSSEGVWMGEGPTGGFAPA